MRNVSLIDVNWMFEDNVGEGTPTFSYPQLKLLLFLTNRASTEQWAFFDRPLTDEENQEVARMVAIICQVMPNP